MSVRPVMLAVALLLVVSCSTPELATPGFTDGVAAPTATGHRRFSTPRVPCRPGNREHSVIDDVRGFRENESMLPDAVTSSIVSVMWSDPGRLGDGADSEPHITVFARASDALRAAIELQSSAPRSEHDDCPAVRVAIDTGEIDSDDLGCDGDRTTVPTIASCRSSGPDPRVVDHRGGRPSVLGRHDRTAGPRHPPCPGHLGPGVDLAGRRHRRGPLLSAAAHPGGGRGAASRSGHLVHRSRRRPRSTGRPGRTATASSASSAPAAAARPDWRSNSRSR